MYKKVLAPLLVNTKKRKVFMAVIAAVFVITMLFPLAQLVKFRMLPKANKNTFLVSIDMPAGTALRTLDRAARAAGDYLRRIPEVKDYETFVGTGSVIDFNGLLRGGAFREASHFCRHPREPYRQGRTLRIEREAGAHDQARYREARPGVRREHQAR